MGFFDDYFRLGRACIDALKLLHRHIVCGESVRFDFLFDITPKCQAYVGDTRHDICDQQS